MYILRQGVPVPTLSISGVHEDHKWLSARDNMELVPNLFWLINGYKTTIGDLKDSIRVTGLGKAFSDATYNYKYNRRSFRHYSRKEVERACFSGPTDILLLYETPDSPGLDHLIFATRPKLICYTHKEQHKNIEEIQGIPVLGLKRDERIFIDFDRKGLGSQSTLK